MTTKTNFTKAKIGSLAVPEKGKRVYYRDSKTSGLILQITGSGTKSFQVYKWMGDRPIRVTLGRYPETTIEQARKKALKKLADLSDGINPNKKKKAEKLKSITLQKVFDDYLAARKALKPLTVQDYKKAMRETFPDWMNKPMRALIAIWWLIDIDRGEDYQRPVQIML